MKKNELPRELVTLLEHPFFKHFLNKKTLTIEEALLCLVVIHEISFPFFGKAPFYKNYILQDLLRKGELSSDDVLKAANGVEGMFSTNDVIHHSMLKNFVQPLLTASQGKKILTVDNFLLYSALEKPYFYLLKKNAGQVRKVLSSMFNKPDTGAVACAVIECLTPRVATVGSAVAKKTKLGNEKIFTEIPTYVQAHTNSNVRHGFEVLHGVADNHKHAVKLLNTHSSQIIDPLNDLFTTAKRLL